MRKKVGASTYIQRINTLERKLLKQVKELDDVIQKHPGDLSIILCLD
jgi:hypothetical protein